KIRENPNQQYFEEDPFVAAWDLNVHTDMLTLPARVLPMPEIVYTDRYQVTSEAVRDLGIWEMRPTQFHKPATFPAVWAMINLTHLGLQECNDFCNELCVAAKKRGIDCHLPQIYEKYDTRHCTTDEIIASLKDMMNKNDDC
ncbi:unnamed protein product, partial [Rotaria sordida]